MRRTRVPFAAAVSVLAAALPAAAAPAHASEVALAGDLSRPDAHLDRGFHLEARASLSLERTGWAVGVAGYRTWKHFEAGAFVEVNPWFNIVGSDMSAGTTNLGVTANWRLRLRDGLRLRAGLGVGASVLNEAVAGSRAGTMGPYLNLRLLGLVWNVKRRVALTLDAFDLALPVPITTGVPVLYAQYRATVGVRF
jgi:hypothetical protein